MKNPVFLTETTNMTQQESFAPSTDLISELLTGMRLRGVQYRRIQAGPDFGLAFKSRPGHAYFHYLAVGHAQLRTDDGALHTLPARSAVFLPRGDAHQLLSRADLPVQDIDTFQAAPLGDAVSGVDTCPSTHPVPSAVLFYGCMTFDLGGMHALARLMPAIMVAETDARRYPALTPMLDALKSEICAGRIGFAGILARLAEVMAAMIVRGWVERGRDHATGLVAALRDPRLGRALLALHRRPGHDWTVEELAAQSHVSRSVFAQRFQAMLGTPPLRYAIQLRMRLASQWLSEDRLPIDTVAQRLGYTSQAAFSRAFKRVTGHSPGAARQR